MFIPISIDDYVRSHMENNPDDNKAKVENAVRSATAAKKNGARCMQCGQPIWAIGTATVGWNGCFSCICGEADNSEDFEIDSVCY